MHFAVQKISVCADIYINLHAAIQRRIFQTVECEALTFRVFFEGRVDAFMHQPCSLKFSGNEFNLANRKR